MPPRVAVTGASGQLGRALIALAGDDWDITGTSSSHVDVRDWNAVRAWIATVRPDFVIHAGAMTDVDGCESRAEDAYAINALGSRHVAAAAARIGAQLVYVSTNFVFDGELDRPYHEFDQPNPMSVYGASKLAGEREVLRQGSAAYIVRTAMVYDETGHNFVNTMKRLMAERESISVVADQFGNPTFAPDLATGILELLRFRPPGTYHLTNTGSTSWHGWASEIARLTDFGGSVEPIDAASYVRAATPPANGVMTSLAWPEAIEHLPDWRDALARCLG